MARTRKSLPEGLRIVIDDLTFVLKMVKMGRVNEDRMDDLTRCIWRMREEAPLRNTEQEMVRAYLEAHEAENRAADALAAHFMPLARAVTTEKEARDLIYRVPGCAVLKAFMMDHFCRVSKVIPIPERKA